jgi:hypothetical protein
MLGKQLGDEAGDGVQLSHSNVPLPFARERFRAGGRC